MSGMSDMSNLKRLQEVLDIHGAEPRRWPQAEREALHALVARDPAARKAVAEAAALDRLLAKAPPADAARIADLSQRILAATAPSPVMRTGAHPVPRTPVRRWAVPAALAASLMLGIVVGSAGWAPETIQEFAGLTGVSSDLPASEDITADDGALL